VSSGVETSTSVKPTATAAVESSATAAVESSAPTVTSTLGKHRLRQPTERNHRDEDKNYSK
jgi:hypothetical protein